ncbi:hypothetical protein [Alicycliphilus denitrificans]|uniref:hypothetical protein n=1 Tax=Alicycliphilus denitrificans TaxID=179636 RepID=UPI00384D4A67
MAASQCFFHPMRTTGTPITSNTLGESVKAFVPHPLPPSQPPLAPESFAAANRAAETALAQDGLLPPPLPHSHAGRLGRGDFFLLGVERVRQKLGTSFPTANAAVQLLAELGIVTELTGQKKTAATATSATLS